MGLAAFECGAAAVSLKNPDKLHIENGKLLFKISVTHAQIEAGSKANPIKARADLILRKFDRAMETPEYAGWLAEMAWAWTYALNEPDQLNALALSIMKCAAVGELAFFERALRPLIASRFDPSKRVIFTLPEFMPNFS